MFRLFFVFSIIGIALSCNSTQAIKVDNANQNFVILQPKIEPNSSPIRISPNLKLSANQKKTLDNSLPPKVREILENADRFEILAEVIKKDGKLAYPVKEDFKPNTKVEVSDANLRKELLETFYADAASGEFPSDCWLPHHILKAGQGDKIIEIEICFSCSRFEVKSSLGTFSGTFAHSEEPKSEIVFNRIIESNGVQIQQ
ncbi:MAG: hypothetical protein M3033_05685 [Acidobacteriota bacterium]|nr:hypothetical protein [Acidobacteriota bacterium]